MAPHRVFAFISAVCCAVCSTAPGAEEAAAVFKEVSASPSKAPAIAAAALQPADRVTPRLAAQVTRAAITALGANPAASRIAAIVHAEVKAAPDRVLDIVRAAVTVSPREAAEEIAASAVLAVPDPWRRVVYTRTATPQPRGERDYKGEPDFKGEPDYKDPARGEAIPMTLAEAIVQTALEAGASAPGVYAAVEAALRSAPGRLITAIYDPRGISGVGDAGTNNYANEPFRRRPPTLSPKPGPSPVKPRVPATPPPVSP